MKLKIIFLPILFTILMLLAGCGSSNANQPTMSQPSTSPNADQPVKRATPPSNSTTTANPDSWIVSKTVERTDLICKGCGGGCLTNGGYCYLFTVTVKKDKPSSYVGLDLQNTDIDGDWKDEPDLRKGVELTDTIQENPDGTVTYENIFSFSPQKDYRNGNKPYNAKYHYEYLLIRKDGTYTSSAPYCFPDLPC